MRTTIDLPDDLHAQAMAIARDTRRSFNQTVALLVRRGLNQGGQGCQGVVSESERTGLPTITLGKVVTSEDVRSLEDE
ncbi:antitoxin [Nocardia sp. NPDC058666]|uniref:antitoxin n=1 Tax=Nocardia sp. NPDC058666 TaxID=3346587 RepID=UPI00365BB2C6